MAPPGGLSACGSSGGRACPEAVVIDADRVGGAYRYAFASFTAAAWRSGRVIEHPEGAAWWDGLVTAH